MKRRYGGLVIISMVILAAGLVWGWQSLRAVDGRTATEWLVFAHQASQRVSYRASGQTTWQGVPATFALNQGVHGRYRMRVTDARGQVSALGNDGRCAWYQADGNTVRTASVPPAPEPAPARSRILGTATVAGRRCVRLRVQSGHVRKDLSIDRQTGVTLAKVTAEGQREVSRMHIEQIAYSPVAVAACPCDAATTMPSITDRDALDVLGVPPVKPAWLPAGMKACGVFREWCHCCRQQMVVLRFADGMRAVTLFEMAGTHPCAAREGCHKAPSSGELIDSRRIGKVTVIAVGNVSRPTLAKVLASLR